MSEPRACNCGSGKPRRALYDARGIFCAYVCNTCEADKRATYRDDVFNDPDYWHDEPIEED